MTKNLFLANIYKYKFYFLIYFTVLVIACLVIIYNQIQDKKFNTSFNFKLKFKNAESQSYMTGSTSGENDSISKYEEIKYKLTNNNEIKKKYFQDLDNFFDKDLYNYLDNNYKDINYSNIKLDYENTKKDKIFLNFTSETEEIYNNKKVVIEHFELLFKQKLKDTFINQHKKVVKFIDNAININDKKQKIYDNLFENILLSRYDRLIYAIELIDTNKLYSEIADEASKEEATIVSNYSGTFTDSVFYSGSFNDSVIDRLANINTIDLVKIGKKELLLETNFLSNIIKKYYSDKDEAISEIKSFYGLNQTIEYQKQTMLNIKRDQTLLIENIKNEDPNELLTKLNVSLDSNSRVNPISLLTFKNIVYIFIFGLITVFLINYFILEYRRIRDS